MASYSGHSSCRHLCKETGGKASPWFTGALPRKGLKQWWHGWETTQPSPARGHGSVCPTQSTRMLWFQPGLWGHSQVKLLQTVLCCCLPAVSMKWAKTQLPVLGAQELGVLLLSPMRPFWGFELWPQDASGISFQICFDAHSKTRFHSVLLKRIWQGVCL